MISKAFLFGFSPPFAGGDFFRGFRVGLYGTSNTVHLYQNGINQ